MTALPFYYEAYCLRIASEIELPELRSMQFARTEADIVIRLAVVDGPMPPPGDLRLTDFSADTAYFAWHMLGRIRVTGWSEIAVDPDPALDRSVLGLVLLGPVMASILHARGLLVLHGAAVVPGDGGVILIVGDNGAGKSTLAAACVRLGFEMLNDDVIAVEPRTAGACVVRPGYPSVKLSLAACAAISPLPGSPLPSPPGAKIRIRLTDGTGLRHNLAALYVLERDTVLTVEPLTTVATLSALMRYGYMVKFGSSVLRGDAGALYFRHCATVADRISGYRLRVPTGLDHLHDTARELQRHRGGSSISPGRAITESAEER